MASKGQIDSIVDIPKIEQQVTYLTGNLDGILKRLESIGVAAANIKFEGFSKARNIQEVAASSKELEVSTKNLSQIEKEMAAAIKEREKAAKALEKQRQRGLAQMAKEEAKERELRDAINMTVKSKADLIKQTQALTKAQAQLDTTTEEGRKKFEAYGKQINANNTQLKKMDADINVHSRNVGNYSSAWGEVASQMGLSGSIMPKVNAGLQLVMGGFVKLRKAIISTGIDALVVVLGSLIAAFKTSEEGQNKWAKAMGVVRAIVGNFVDILASLGEKLIWVFENPKQALTDFANMIKQNIVDRFTGLLELIPAIGKAIGHLFRGEFAEAGKVAFDAVAKVTTGVENLTDKITGATKAVGDFIKEQEREAKLASQVAEMRAKADIEERNNLIERSKREGQIAELRLKARQEDEYTAVQRQAFLKQAAALEDDLLEKETNVLKLRADAQTLENTFARTTKENKDKEAQLIADLNRQEAKRFDTQREFRRELNKLNREVARDEAEVEKARLAAIAAAEKARRDSLKRDIEISELKLAIVKKGTEQELQFTIDMLNKKMELELAEAEDSAERQNLIVAKYQKIIAEKELDFVKSNLDKQTAERITALELAQEQELNAIENNLRAGNISVEQYQAQRKDILRRYQDEGYVLMIEAAQKEMELLRANGEDVTALEKKIFEAKKLLRDNELTDVIDKANKELEIERQKQEAIKALYQQLYITINSFAASYFDNQMMRMDSLRKKDEEEKAAEIERAGGNKRLINQIEEKYAELAKQRDAEQKRIELQRARFDKISAIFSVALNTAQAIMKAVAASPLTGGLPFSAIAGAIGAAQIAAILARPLPKYAGGREGGQAEFAIVGEAGREAIQTKDGQLYLTPDRATVTFLPQHADVIPNSKLIEMTKRSVVSNTLPGAPDVSRELQSIDQGIGRLSKIVRNKKEYHINITEKGMYSAVKNQQRWVEYISKNVRL